MPGRLQLEPGNGYTKRSFNIDATLLDWSSRGKGDAGYDTRARSTFCGSFLTRHAIDQPRRAGLVLLRGWLDHGLVRSLPRYFYWAAVVAKERSPPKMIPTSPLNLIGLTYNFQVLVYPRIGIVIEAPGRPGQAEDCWEENLHDLGNRGVC